jgi:diguanylate cyclase (GGDEF)-like protein/PAS domain S-box-containing protein
MVASKMNIPEKMTVRLLMTSIFACLLWLCGFLYFSHERTAMEKMHLANQTSGLNMIYNCVVNAQEIGMQAYFDSFVMQPQVLEILHHAREENEAEQAVQRVRLYRCLLPAYELLRERGVRQFHFHTVDNRSFLRFHAPHLSGDSLVASRPSVVMANREQKVVQGFETGRILAGYRSVFPIVYEGEALGTVEISQPFEKFRRMMEKVGEGTEFLISYDASLLLPKLFDEQKKMYTASLFSPDWLVEDVHQDLPDSPPDLSPKAREVYAGLSQLPAFIWALAEKQPQSLAIGTKQGFYQVTLLPIVDPEGLSSMLLLALSSAPELDEILQNFRLHLLAFTGLVVLISFMLLLFLRNNHAISAKQGDFQLIANTISDGLYVMNEQGVITFVNESAARLLGYSRTALLGQVAHNCFHQHQDDEGSLLHCPLCNVFRSNTRFQGEEVFYHQDGTTFVAEVASEPLLEKDRGISAVTIFRDISERKQMEEQLHELCNTDPLTKAFNRRYFLEVLETEVQRSRRYATPFALVMGDVDHFKRVNDVFGHQAGDQILKEVVAAIQARIRSSDVFARWGGEEFVLLLSSTSLESAVPLVESIRENIRSLDHGEVGTVTISFGVTTIRDGDVVDTVLNRSDKLLYEAKAAGRNCVRFSG